MIAGLQKMTLLDFPGRVACTVFLGGCDMRCPFCHNAELIDGSAPAALDEQELLRFLGRRKGLLDGVCVSAAEPTLQPELADFLREIKALGYAVKLDTNGSRPAVLKGLVEEKLVDWEPTLVIVLADGAKGFECVFRTKACRPSLSVFWFSDDREFGMQSYRMDCAYFSTKPVTSEKIAHAIHRHYSPIVIFSYLVVITY